MYAVIVRVNITDPDSAESVLRDQVVPRVSQLPGFVTGYWTRKDDKGLSMIVFQSFSTSRGACAPRRRAHSFLRTFGMGEVSQLSSPDRHPARKYCAALLLPIAIGGFLWYRNRRAARAYIGRA